MELRKAKNILTDCPLYTPEQLTTQDPKYFAISAIDFAKVTRNHSHGRIEKTDARGSETSHGNVTDI